MSPELPGDAPSHLPALPLGDAGLLHHEVEIACPCLHLYTLTINGDLRIKAHFIPDGSESFEAWISSRAEVGKQGPNDDGLGNGRANIIDYFLGQDSSNERFLNPSFRATPLGYEINVPFNLDAQDVVFEVLYSKDLAQWYTLDTVPNYSTTEGLGKMSYEINQPSDESLFFTVRVYRVE